MIFQATPDQITSLKSDQLVELLKRLMLAECRKVGIPLRAATVPLQITIADGGEDARVEWQGGVMSTDYFPGAFTIFQSKAQNLTKSTIRNEIAKLDRKGARRSNDAIVEVIRRGGAYVVFCSHAFGGPKIAALCNEIRDTIRLCGNAVPRAVTIDVYDANKIADWVNTHPSVALWLTETRRGKSVAGFQTQDGWAKAVEVAEIAWVDNQHPRYSSSGVDAEGSDRSARERSTWTFHQAASHICDHLSRDRAVVRIAGPSGFGKTRFAFEVFNGRVTVADAIDSAALLYADFAIAGDEVAKLALEIADNGAPVIMVVDECPDELHTKLAEISRRAGSKLRLVSIDIETRVAPTDDTLVIRLGPADEQTIRTIARTISPTLSDSATRIIEQLADGFPRMAVLAAPHGGVGRRAIQSAEEVLDRVIWGRRSPNEEALKALQAASLFEWLGLDGSAEPEGALVAEHLAQMAPADFVAQVRSFRGRGIVVTKADYVQISPVPLAAVLAAQRFALLTQSTTDAFFAIAPEHLKLSMLARMRWLDRVPEARDFARRVLAPSVLGRLDVLRSDFGAECIDRLVHVDPDAVMRTFQRILGPLDAVGLRRLGHGRRHLVWALERLAFRKESFDAAATLLRKLAAAETEHDISNNATGQFQQLFQIHLAGTEAPPAMRLRVLDDGLGSADLNEQAVCIGALDQMLKTFGLSRIGGVEQIGSDKPLEDWRPGSLPELQAYLTEAVSRLLALAHDASPHREKARHILASHLRDLIDHLPLQQIRAMVTAAEGGRPWREAIRKVNSWLYFDRTRRPTKLGDEVRMFYDELLPTDAVELVALYASGHLTEFNDPDTSYEQSLGANPDFEFANRQLVLLAERVARSPELVSRSIMILATMHTLNVFPFAKRLAEAIPKNMSLFGATLKAAEAGPAPANREFFSGLIAGIANRNPESARKCIRLAFRSPALKDHAIHLMGSIKLQAADFHWVASLVRAGKVNPRHCTSLANGRGLDHLDSADIAPLLQALSVHGSEGLWATLDIVHRLRHRGKPMDKTLAKVVLDALLSSQLFESAPDMGGLQFKDLVEVLGRNGLLGERHVRGIAKQIFGLLQEDRAEAFRAMGDSARLALVSLIARFPADVWPEVANAAESSDTLVQHRLSKFLSPSSNDELGPGPPFEVPRDLYVAWVRADPRQRARWPMKWLPIAVKAPDGQLSWHMALESYVQDFHEAPGVLSELAIRLHPTSWWGSIEPHLQPALNLLGSWGTHPIAKVRQFAGEQKRQLLKEIEAARRREAEDTIRPF